MKLVTVSELAFADNLVLIAKSEEDLQYNLNYMEFIKKNMRLNVAKTETMILSREEQKHNIKLEGQTLQQVNYFKYLGSTISHDRRVDEIKNRTTATGRLYHIINKNFLNKKEISKIPN